MNLATSSAHRASRIAVCFWTVAGALAATSGTALSAELETIASRYRVVRLNDGQPIVTDKMFTALGAPDNEAENMNGPSVIRVPDWITPEQRADRRAKYYLYFAHHVGQYIRMAWAEKPTGPWTLYHVGAQVEPGSRGVLDLGAEKMLEIAPGIALFNHVAAPDVHVDEKARRIVMYFHSPGRFQGERLSQRTCVALSADGLAFRQGIVPVALGNSYARVFNYGGNLFSLGFGGALHQAPPGQDPWTAPPDYSFNDSLWPRVGAPFTDALSAVGITDQKVRHVGLLPQGQRLEVFFTLIGATPETVLLADIDLAAGPPAAWRPQFPPEQVLRAELPWEGGDLPPITSKSNKAPEDINQLRDPRPFVDVDGTLYLFYSGRGENALGVARLERAR